jgi:prepilin-type N-terminal cleavage/methylation domain-containing protein
MKKCKSKNLAFTLISKACKGFTIIELLITISVLALLLTIGLVYYQDFNRRQIINQAAKDLKSNLRLAQSRALAGEKPQGWCGGEGETLAGYRLEFISEIDYQISAVCSNADIKLTKIVQLPDSVVGPSGAGVLFRVLAQGAEAGTDFLLQGFGQERRVTVEVSGNIKIE